MTANDPEMIRIWKIVTSRPCDFSNYGSIQRLEIQDAYKHFERIYGRLLDGQGFQGEMFKVPVQDRATVGDCITGFNAFYRIFGDHFVNALKTWEETLLTSAPEKRKAEDEEAPEAKRVAPEEASSEKPSLLEEYSVAVDKMGSYYGDRIINPPDGERYVKLDFASPETYNEMNCRFAANHILSIFGYLWRVHIGEDMPALLKVATEKMEEPKEKEDKGSKEQRLRKSMMKLFALFEEYGPYFFGEAFHDCPSKITMPFPTTPKGQAYIEPQFLLWPNKVKIGDKKFKKYSLFNSENVGDEPEKRELFNFDKLICKEEWIIQVLTVIKAWAGLCDHYEETCFKPLIEKGLSLLGGDYLFMFNIRSKPFGRDCLKDIKTTKYRLQTLVSHI